MKALFFIALFVSFFTTPPDIAKVRENYTKALADEAITDALYTELSSITKTDNEVLVAYKGAVFTLMAKFGKGIGKKTEFFKEGVDLIEYAVSASPENIEIRMIRMSVQEHAPKFLKYHINIPEDKQFILDNYTSTSKVVKEYVKGFVMQSEGFSISEKELF